MGAAHEEAKDEPVPDQPVAALAPQTDDWNVLSHLRNPSRGEVINASLLNASL